MEFVQSYRSFLSLPQPDKTLVPAQKLLEKVKVLMGQEYRNGNFDFEVFSNPIDLELFIDEKQISQILVNLGKNALESLHGQYNGKVKIIAGSAVQGKNYIKVSDNGPEIVADLIDEILVPFFTTKSTGSGIGLGLSKQIMHLHGGTMKVHSLPFKETSFVLGF